MRKHSRNTHRIGIEVEKDIREESELHRWGVILAGGDGTRLRSLTRIISGDERPKQFCRILGDESLLERTVKRVEMGIPRNNILLSVTRTHERFYSYLYDKFDRSRFAEQPANLGTAPAILYSLLRIAKVDPEASVTFFPSDHYLSDDEIFMKQVEAVFEGVERQPGNDRPPGNHAGLGRNGIRLDRALPSSRRLRSGLSDASQALLGKTRQTQSGRASRIKAASGTASL